MSPRARHLGDSIAFLWSSGLGDFSYHPRSEQDGISVLHKGNKLAAPGQTQYSVMFPHTHLWCFGKKKDNLALTCSRSQIKFQIWLLLKTTSTGDTEPTSRVATGTPVYSHCHHSLFPYEYSSMHLHSTFLC